MVPPLRPWPGDGDRRWTGPSASPSDGRQQVLADHQSQTVLKEEQQSEQLLELPNQILELTKTILMRGRAPMSITDHELARVREPTTAP